MMWTEKPKCQKCRKLAPAMEWGRWAPLRHGVYVESNNPIDLEALLCICVRCGWQWLMTIAPPEKVVA